MRGVLAVQRTTLSLSVYGMLGDRPLGIESRRDTLFLPILEKGAYMRCDYAIREFVALRTTTAWAASGSGMLR